MRKLLIALVFLPAVAAAQPAPSPSNEPPPPTAQQLAEARVLQTFIDESTIPCETQPAQTCVDLAWKFAVKNPREGLTVEDLQQLRNRLGSWYAVNRSILPPRAQMSLSLGMMLADGMGMDRLHAAFDTNHDGKVSQQELLADVKMDRRPLGQVLSDPNSVDRPKVAQKIGLPPAITESLFRAASGPQQARP
ncbi:MAG TPA: hypothetical protein VL966_09840 [Alphaproteobacteria bacterium]|jgi:hypothetical protein|nr:hypothetical protein [Alphaproteobacteria bacterium]